VAAVVSLFLFASLVYSVVSSQIARYETPVGTLSEQQIEAEDARREREEQQLYSHYPEPNMNEMRAIDAAKQNEV
jgi:hypothetical protein